MITKSVRLSLIIIIALSISHVQAQNFLPETTPENLYQVVNIGTQHMNEDYLSCDTPSAQPKSVQIDSVSTSFFTGHFDAATDATGYLVIIGDSIKPAFVPAGGTNYTVGSTVGNYKVMKAGTGTTFSTSGLTANSYYYVYIYAMKTGCAGGPVYRTISPSGTLVHTTTSDRSNQKISGFD